MKGFEQALRACAQAGRVPVIPDLKSVSPGAGPLFPAAQAAERAREMERARAPALSVVTESAQFGGSLEMLSQVVQAVDLPVLRKDFIRTTAEVEQTARLGARAILLICACLEEALLRQLYQAALSCGLEPLVEAHTVRELQLAAALGARLVGINNRDILQLERDGGTVDTTLRLAAEKPEHCLLISESGIQTPADARAALRGGADAVLVGTAIWRSGDPAAFYQALSRAGEGGA